MSLPRLRQPLNKIEQSLMDCSLDIFRLFVLSTKLKGSCKNSAFLQLPLILFYEFIGS